MIKSVKCITRGGGGVGRGKEKMRGKAVMGRVVVGDHREESPCAERTKCATKTRKINHGAKSRAENRGSYWSGTKKQGGGRRSGSWVRRPRLRFKTPSCRGESVNVTVCEGKENGLSKKTDTISGKPPKQ